MRPDQRAALRQFVSEALGLLPLSDEDDILVWRFTNVGTLCAQFSLDALDHKLAARGAWLEVVSDERLHVEDLRGSERPRVPRRVMGAVLQVPVGDRARPGRPACHIGRNASWRRCSRRSRRGA